MFTYLLDFLKFQFTQAYLKFHHRVNMFSQPLTYSAQAERANVNYSTPLFCWSHKNSNVCTDYKPITINTQCLEYQVAKIEIRNLR